MNYGRAYSHEALRQSCGTLEQIARIKSVELTEGRARGVRCLEFRTGSGLNFTAVADRGLDLAEAEYRGVNLAWMSATGIAHPGFHETEGRGWLRGFYGGLLTTCGLVNVGVPGVWEGVGQGMHGRASFAPATNVSHDSFSAEDTLYLLARGECREANALAENLTLRRRIRAMAGERRLFVQDTVANEGFSSVPHQILYHINVGFPIVSAHSVWMSATRTLTPRDSIADAGHKLYAQCQDPTTGYREQVFYHEVAPATDGRAWVAIANPEIGAGGMGVYVKYDPKVLPILTQWKMMSEGAYVMGIEPANSYGLGFDYAKDTRTLKMIEPGEQVEYQLEIGVLDGAYDLESFERETQLAVSSATPRIERPARSSHLEDLPRL